MASESSSPVMTEEESFSRALLNSRRYPDNLPQQDPPKLVYIFKRHFQIARDKITHHHGTDRLQTADHAGASLVVHHRPGQARQGKTG